MSTSKIILRNRHGAEVATIFFDEESHRWRIVSKAEPKFKRDFPTQKEAFDVWHANFDSGTGKLRKWR
jgi:predicted secreted protein